MIKAVVFDLDGTLLNTLEDLCNATNYALVKQGYKPISVDETRKNIGHGIKNLLIKSSNDSCNILSMLSDFKIYYTKHCNDFTKPYDGILELLNRLKSDGFKLGCVSNKAKYALDILVENHFKGYFDCVLGDGEGYKRKPDSEIIVEASKRLGVKLDEFLYVGDSDVDVLTVLNSKCYGIFVSYGYRDINVLKDAGATLIVNSPLEIYELVNKEI